MSIEATCMDGGKENAKKVKMDTYEIGISSNGRYQARGKSSKCSHMLYRFLSEADAKKLAKGKPIKKWPVNQKKKKERDERKKRKKERKEKQKEKEKKKKQKEKEKKKKLKEKAKKKK